jgi:hypothetical protein
MFGFNRVSGQGQVMETLINTTVRGELVEPFASNTEIS